MTKRKKPFGVYIGRFQPLHNGHAQTILAALGEVEKLIIVVGSSFSPRTAKNPFTFEERRALIVNFMMDEGIPSGRYKIVGVRDQYYNDEAWRQAVIAEVKLITKDNPVWIIGNNKDRSSYYLKLFNQWEFLPSRIVFAENKVINATDIRSRFYGQNIGEVYDIVPQNVYNFLKKYEAEDRHYADLVEEYHYIERYPQERAESGYPINEVTVDAVLFKANSVLLVKRGRNPGKGLLALPGGFLGIHESPIQGALRELREETNLKTQDSILLVSHKEEKVFAYPYRSARGRVISIAQFFDLGDDPYLPPVSGSDDADTAIWYPIEEVLLNPQKFFEDHWSIIQYFWRKSG